MQLGFYLRNLQKIKPLATSNEVNKESKQHDHYANENQLHEEQEEETNEKTINEIF